jgi:hypothetical protein
MTRLRRLTELELLPMRVPDQRVAISPAISTPSCTHLPAGKIAFVLFRRDLANAAPDRVAVRVIAQVVRALTFDPGGKPATAKIADTWVVRSNAYQMRVAPVPENPEPTRRTLSFRPDATRWCSRARPTTLRSMGRRRTRPIVSSAPMRWLRPSIPNVARHDRAQRFWPAAMSSSGSNDRSV